MISWTGLADTHMHDESSLLRLLNNERAANHDDDGETTLGDVEQLGLQVRETKRLDDQTGEDTKTTNDERRRDLEHDVAPDDGVLDGLDDLVLLVGPVLDTGLIGTDTLDHEALGLLAEALGGHGRVGQPPADEGGPDAGGDAEDHEEELPGVDDAVRVVGDAPGDDTTNLGRSIKLANVRRL